MNETRRIRLGTRGSALARWQADWVTSQLTAMGIPVEQVLITTQGDARSGPIGAIGTQGVFTKEIQRALLDDRVDLAVHSLKDLPTEPVDGLCLAVVPTRASTHDVLVSPADGDFEDLSEGARIGTGSLRRRAQLLHRRADLKILPIRGNVDTRLKQLDDGQFDAIVLAEAGLRRLGWEDRITRVLPHQWMLPAVGQGALGLETREDDRICRDLIAPLNDVATHAAVLAERALLAELRGGCLAPVGAWGRVDGDQLQLDAAVLDLNGSQRLAAGGQTDVAGAETLGREVATRLLDQGAAELIASARDAASK